MKNKNSSDKLKKYIILLIIFIIIALVTIAVIVIVYIQKNVDNRSNNISMINEENETNNMIKSDYKYTEFNEEKIVKVAGEENKKVEYKIKRQDALGVFSAVIFNNKVYIIKEDISGKFKQTYGNSVIETGKEYEVSELNSKPIDINIGYIGIDYTNPVVTILTSDGYIQVVTLKEGLSKGSFIAGKNIGSNIVRVDNVIVTKDNKTEMSIIITSQDGTSYNIKDLI